jgi:pectin methylesterase-like acyl-CoA thioesterase
MVRILIISILLSLVSASSLSYDRKACQKPGNTKLKGCPKHTLVVGPSSNFTSIQHAVLSIPNNNDPYTILIQPGNYTEKLNITRPGPLTLLGVTVSPNDKAGNRVNVIWHNATGTATTGTYDNAYTSTLTVAPTLTGFAVPLNTPFGNIDFRTYNLNFINDYLPYAAGPSLALSLSYANGGFYYTRFLSYQDTVRPATPFCRLNH